MSIHWCKVTTLQRDRVANPRSREESVCQNVWRSCSSKTSYAQVPIVLARVGGPGSTDLKFGNTLLENRIPVGRVQTGEPFVDALDELSEPAAPANKPRPGEVAPIEKLDLLIRLSQSKMGRTDDERLLMVEIAKSLLARDSPQR